MGTTALRQLLRNLCDCSQWQYAVFWKLKHRSRMILTWEDGYCDHPKPGGSVDIISNDIYFNEMNGNTFGCEMSHGSIAVSPVELAVANMSCLLYSLGEGVVGKVASTGRHTWIFSDKTYAGGFNSKLHSEFPDEWIPQFTAGIKTILLVPVVPHGVVQLGSLDTVAEDLALVAHIKTIFNSLQYAGGASMPSSESRDLLSHPSTSPTSLLEGFTESSTTNSNLLTRIQSEDPVFVDGFNLTNDKPPTTSPQVMSHIMAPDKFQVPGKDLNPILETVAGAEFGDLSVGPTEESVPQIQFTKSNNLTGSNILRFSCLEEDDRAYFQYDTPLDVFGNCSSMNLTFHSDGDMMDQPSGNEFGSDTNYKILSSSFSFPAESELHKALGPAFQIGCNNYTWDSTISVDDACDSLSLICHKDLTGGAKPSLWPSKGPLTNEDDSEQLLDAMIPSVYDVSDNIRSTGAGSPTTSLWQLAVAACQKQSTSEGSVLMHDDLVPWSYMKSAVIVRDENVLTSSSSGSSSFKSTMSALVEEKQQKGFGYMPSWKGEKLSHPKRRSSGDIQRPRPRDRQMIQDRVKELRDLVPNGAKCSIDALLDRTIKHMLFLRSVTNQAKKLRQCMNPEIAARKHRKSTGIKDHQNGGASWVFDWGNQIDVYPVIVEDVNDDGHMLIEMLCEEQGLFLEIAEVIRNLELTILKGVMENRADKMRAHFIVEVSRHFQKTDIFWPLMQLYQRKGKSLSSRY